MPSARPCHDQLPSLDRWLPPPPVPRNQGDQAPGTATPAPLLAAARLGSSAMPVLAHCPRLSRGRNRDGAALAYCSPKRDRQGDCPLASLTSREHFRRAGRPHPTPALTALPPSVQIVAAILAIAGIVMMTYADGFHSHSVIGIALVVGSASMSALYKVGQGSGPTWPGASENLDAASPGRGAVVPSGHQASTLPATPAAALGFGSPELSPSVASVRVKGCDMGWPSNQ